MGAPSNPNAFPFAAEYGHPAACGGMTLRDWFAGQIGCGYLSGVIIDGETGCTLTEPEILAKKFYAIADAMLAERAKAGAA